MISVFELFKIGIGPSSSHTVGPMKAAAAFAKGLVETGAIDRVASLEVALLGSLAFTGRGHATDKAVILGLSGEMPETVDLDAAEAFVARVRETKTLGLVRRRVIPFNPERAIVFDTVTPAPRHPNTMRFVARDEEGRALADDLALGRRWVHHPGRRRQRPVCAGTAASLSFSLRRRASGARAPSQAFDRRAHAGQ
jgi:L-serine dehydratase